MVEEIVTSKMAVESLYEQGRVCITAYKPAKIDVKYRPFLALFADGTFLVDERAQYDSVIREIVIGFRIRYPTANELRWQYVSTDFIKEVYLKAQEFDWYLYQYPFCDNLTSAEKQKLRVFLDRISNVKCLSVLTITTPKWFRCYSPDKYKFALFDNGFLVVDEKASYLEDLVYDLGLVFPKINMIETVPEYYISAIYERLLYMQPSAREICIDLEAVEIMEKQKVSKEEAMKILSRDQEKWKKMLLNDEKTARSLIYSQYVRYCFDNRG